jgi:hypothetical protein
MPGYFFIYRLHGFRQGKDNLIYVAGIISLRHVAEIADTELCDHR